jgi:hypothetical protein
MPQGRWSLTTGHRWDHAVGADRATSAERIAGGPARRASYEPQLLRELLKPILDELHDTLERFEGDPIPADHRWLRGQRRRLVDRLDLL